MKKLIVVLLACIGLKANAQISYYLSNKFWKLKHAVIGGREYQLAGNSNVPTLQFSGGSIRGNGGCNAYHTKFTINGSTLQIDKIMSTRMACNSLELEEAEFFSAMTQTHTLEYEEGSNEFRLINANNDLLEFYSPFERTQSSYSPPVNSQSEREYRYTNNDNDDVRPALSKKQARRKADLERKMKRGKLTKAERRELIKLQSKAKKSKIRKSKRGKTIKGKRSRKVKASSKKSKSTKKTKTKSRSKKKRK